MAGPFEFYDQNHRYQQGPFQGGSYQYAGPSSQPVVSGAYPRPPGMTTGAGSSSGQGPGGYPSGMTTGQGYPGGQGQGYPGPYGPAYPGPSGPTYPGTTGQPSSGPTAGWPTAPSGQGSGTPSSAAPRWPSGMTTGSSRPSSAPSSSPPPWWANAQTAQGSQPTSGYYGSTPSAPTYQGPPPQGGQSNYPPPPPPPYQGPPPQGGQSNYPPPPQAPPSQYPNTGTVPPWWQGGSPSTPPGPDWPPPPPYPGYGGPGSPGGPYAPAPGGPAPAPSAAPASHAMPGWDQGKWADPSKHDAKYDAGRLMSTLAPSVANIPQVLAMLQQGGHQVQYGGGDTAVIDGYTVDLVQGSKSGHPAWQWYVPQDAPAPPQGQGQGGMDPYTAMFMQQMMGGGPQFQGPPVPQDPNNTGFAGGADQTALLQSIMQLLQNQAAAPRGPVAPNFSFY